jgi:hypothetical protein
MRNCWVKVLRRVGAHPCTCFGGNVHCVLSKLDSFSDDGTLCTGHVLLSASQVINPMFSSSC